MTPPKLIGITGKAHTGKDTLAHHLRDKHGHAIIRFAGPLYSALSALFGVSVEYLERHKDDEDFQGTGIPFRRYIQTLGTEWGRNMIHENFWIGLAETTVKQYRRIEGADLPVVVVDIRYENEAAWVREQGGLVIQLHRFAAPPIPGAEGRHDSESGIAFDPRDAIIHNEGDENALRASVDALFKAMANATPAATPQTDPIQYRPLIYGDIIQVGDEFLQYDCVTWNPVKDIKYPCIGLKYHTGLFRPARRPR